ncbi:Uncharacterized protein APZ42_010495, partial [Daphnia magna]
CVAVSAEGCITVIKHSKHAARTETMEKKVTQRRQDKLFLMLYSHVCV